MTSLEDKIATASGILTETYNRYPPRQTVVAWTGGKDSTVLLHIMRRVFDGTVPFPVMFNDSTMEFEEVYHFISYISTAWRLDLRVVKHSGAELKKFRMETDPAGQLESSRMMKINAIERFRKRNHTRAFIVGIRWDEHEARSGEKYISPRGSHTRIHPILDFTEADIWKYIRTFQVPYVGLYDQGYRSLGEKPFTKKAVPGEGERSGREPDKERLMEKLRHMGYW